MNNYTDLYLLEETLEADLQTEIFNDNIDEDLEAAILEADMLTYDYNNQAIEEE